MPIYVCTAALGRLTPVQKTEIAKGITAIYREETGAPGYLVQVIFYDIAPGNHYVAGRPVPADQICIRCDTRSGKTSKQRTQMVRRIMQDVGRACGATEEAVTVLLCEIPVANIAEHGRVAPSPEEDDRGNTQMTSRRDYLLRMIGSRESAGDYYIGAVGHRLAEREFQDPILAPTKPPTREVFALEPDLGTVNSCR